MRLPCLFCGLAFSSDIWYHNSGGLALPGYAYFDRKDMDTLNKRSSIFAAMRAAFPQTLPILAGFLFLGAAYGIYMNLSGFFAVVSDAYELDDFCRFYGICDG